MRRLSFASALQGMQTVPAPARPVEIAPGIDYRLGRGATDMVVTDGVADLEIHLPTIIWSENLIL